MGDEGEFVSNNNFGELEELSFDYCMDYDD